MGRLDRETLDAFRQDGVTVLRGVVSEEWRTRLAAAIEANMSSPGPHGKNHADDEGGAYFGDYVNWQRFEAFKDVGSEGDLGEIAGELMGASKVQLFHEHVLVKEPGNSSATPWHQDLPYYCVDGNQTASVYVALDHACSSRCRNWTLGKRSL